jgi:hypothetical protein
MSRSPSTRTTASALLTLALALTACQIVPQLATTPSQTPTATQTEPPVPPTPSPVPTTGSPGTLSPTPTGMIGPENYPENVNPLTGLEVADPSVLERRPLAIKVSNYPPVVRPQSGLTLADIVYEHLAEGGVTRFTAIFYANDAQKVGSIRSGRLIDLEIPLMYDAFFAYSGSSEGVREKIRAAEFFPERVISPDFGYGEPYFRRFPEEGKAFEHTLFASTFDLWAWADQQGINQRPDLEPGMTFNNQPPQGGTPATSLTVEFSNTSIAWLYNASSGKYLRSTDGVPHTDALTKQQLAFENVILVSAEHVEDTTILEDNVGGGHYSIEIQIWGEGPVTIFRDGQRYEGRWHRAERSDMLTFTDLEGNVLPLRPGTSWFLMVPVDFDRIRVEP